MQVSFVNSPQYIQDSNFCPLPQQTDRLEENSLIKRFVNSPQYTQDLNFCPLPQQEGRLEENSLIKRIEALNPEQVHFIAERMARIFYSRLGLQGTAEVKFKLAQSTSDPDLKRSSSIQAKATLSAEKKSRVLCRNENQFLLNAQEIITESLSKCFSSLGSEEFIRNGIIFQATTMEEPTGFFETILNKIGKRVNKYEFPLDYFLRLVVFPGNNLDSRSVKFNLMEESQSIVFAETELKVELLPKARL